MDLAGEVPGSFARETERAAQRFHDAYGFCACGAAKDELVKLFGNAWAHPSAVGHTQRCERCGGDKHVGDGQQECLVCGHHAGVDADGRVYAFDAPPKRGRPAADYFELAGRRLQW